MSVRRSGCQTQLGTFGVMRHADDRQRWAEVYFGPRPRRVGRVFCVAKSRWSDHKVCGGDTWDVPDFDQVVGLSS